VSEPADIATLAARNNAAWCAIVCGTHDVHGTFEPDAWTCASRTPDNYPDAVTLWRSVDVEGLLARVDATSGCSIKDSFADLDLRPWGFAPLFDATWIHRPAGRSRSRAPAGDDHWRVVRDAPSLVEWENAWGDNEPGARTFLPALLDRSDVAILAIPSQSGAMGTAVLSLGGGVVGVSNVVAGDGDAVAILSVAVDAAARLFPGLDIVGYEQGSMLDAARDAGFDAVGGLRVWMHA
jgi:hypothetical protein